MTPKEKAKSLVEKYYEFNHIGNRHAVKCALIAVDEILNALVYSPTDYGASIFFWNQVKQEIEKL
jgi:hypothetical protein